MLPKPETILAKALEAAVELVALRGYEGIQPEAVRTLHMISSKHLDDSVDLARALADILSEHGHKSFARRIREACAHITPSLKAQVVDIASHPSRIPA